MEESAPVKPVCRIIMEKNLPLCDKLLRRFHPKENANGFFCGLLVVRGRNRHNFLMSHIASMTRKSCSCLRSARIINRVITLIARVDHDTVCRGPWGEHERLDMNAERENKLARLSPRLSSIVTSMNPDFPSQCTRNEHGYVSAASIVTCNTT